MAFWDVNHGIAMSDPVNGKFVLITTDDGGKTWEAGKVPDADNLDFRDVNAFNANIAYLLSIGNGESSRIYKTTDGGKSWTLQFKNTDKQAFFDAMAFWDVNHGIAMSDPVNGKFVLITTDDGGKNWKPIPPERIPAALPGEGGFAASGTCITIQGKNNVWFASGGGSTARVYHSTDRGQTWAVADTPIVAGSAAAGIFSITFEDEKRGIIVGGDYQKPNAGERTVAVTADGGRTWTLAANANGYRSGVAYAKSKGSLMIIAVGTSGSDMMLTNGASWVSLDKENYNSVSATKDGSAIWAAGPKGRIAKYMQSDGNGKKSR
jgi:photosystem II stability/assembly factor-like uncharacterized protein